MFISFINLLIYTKNNILIDSNCYWHFKEIEERLLNKCAYIAFIGADRKYIEKQKYFKYTNISIYKLKDFEKFINYIENGLIRITFKVGVFRKENSKGTITQSWYRVRDNREVFREKLY